MSMNILNCIGQTPLLYLERISRILGAHIYVKMESANPCASIKGRAALAYLRGAMRRGELSRGGCVVEASTGNLALALAQACLKLDLRLLLCMPAFVDHEYRALLHAMGAHVFVTPAEEGLVGAMAKAAWHHEDTWGSFRPNPMVNPDGPACYAEGLGGEILHDAGAVAVDAFVCSVGTGATLAGVGRRLRANNPRIFLGAVTSPACMALGYLPEQEQQAILGNAGLYGGLSPVFDREVVSRHFAVSPEEAGQSCRKLLGMEGIRAGLSSGANLHAALQLAQEAEWKGKNIFTVIHDAGIWGQGNSEFFEPLFP